MVAGIIDKLFSLRTPLSGAVVRPEELNPGDHIYTYRRFGLYSHHEHHQPSHEIILTPFGGLRDAATDGDVVEGTAGGPVAMAALAKVCN
ncbi:hypothetical protein NL676_020374 [Syzygium grande]|nr:hypothetical protein NL676_020374 [Syzygium grande]